MAPDIVTVGGVTLDWVINSEGRFRLKDVAGNAVYSAVGARLWNDRVAILGRIGNDYPVAGLAPFREAGIDLSGVGRLNEPHELVFAARYDADGGRRGFRPAEVFPEMGVTTPEALEEHDYAPDRKGTTPVNQFNATPQDMPAAYWEAKGFHIAGMFYRIQTDFAEEFRRRGVPFTLDPGTARNSLETTDADKRYLLSLPTVFLPSQEQLSWFPIDTDPERAITQLADLGPEAVVIKLGQRGSLVYDRRTGRRRHIPVYRTRVEDPTGAGDAFCGGFLAGYLETGDVFEAALRATISASFVIEAFGAAYALRFGRAEAEARLDTLRASIND